MFTEAPAIAAGAAALRRPAAASSLSRPRGKLYKPPPAIYKLTRRASASGTSEDGHKYRTRNYIFDGSTEFDRHKYGKRKRSDARRPHDTSYDTKRVRKRPAAR